MKWAFPFFTQNACKYWRCPTSRICPFLLLNLESHLISCNILSDKSELKDFHSVFELFSTKHASITPVTIRCIKNWRIHHSKLNMRKNDVPDKIAFPISTNLVWFLKKFSSGNKFEKFSITGLFCNPLEHKGAKNNSTLRNSLTNALTEEVHNELKWWGPSISAAYTKRGDI